MTDTFQFDSTHLGSYVGSMPITKRSVLKLTAKIFDPLGFVKSLCYTVEDFVSTLVSG